MKLSKFKIIGNNFADTEEYLDHLEASEGTLYPLIGGKGSEVSLQSFVIKNDDLIFRHFYHSITCKFEKRSNESTVNFLIVDQKHDNLVIMHKSLRKHAIYFIPSGADFHAIIPSGFSGYNYSLSISYFKKIYGDAGCNYLKSIDVNCVHRLETREEQEKIIQNGVRLLSLIARGNTISYKTLDNVIFSIFSNLIDPVIKDSLVRSQWRKATEDDGEFSHLGCFLRRIDQNLENPPDINSLAKECGISVRQVQNIFKRGLNLSPMEYIKAVRLNAVRDELRNSESYRGLVSAIANKYGFWHMGQFAKEYKALFGCLPTETVERARLEKIKNE